jgi:hypothetical protein
MKIYPVILEFLHADRRGEAVRHNLATSFQMPQRSLCSSVWLYPVTAIRAFHAVRTENPPLEYCV